MFPLPVQKEGANGAVFQKRERISLVCFKLLKNWVAGLLLEEDRLLAAPATYYKGLLVAVVVTAIALAVAAVAWRFPAKEKNDWICIEKLGHCYKASCVCVQA